MNAGKNTMKPNFVPHENLERRNRYGRFMTLCIAAVALNEKKIVTVSDLLMSGSSSSIEARALKVWRIGFTGRWLSMFAGDASHCKIILTKVNSALSEGSSKESGGEMMSLFTAVYQDQLKLYIEESILAHVGMNRDQFIREGRAAFGDEEFIRILNQVTAASLGTEFLVGGFDPGGAHLFSMDNPGVGTLHDAECFHAIGCGATLADATLVSTFDPRLSLTDIVYRLLEAKFRAEAAPGVGKKTYISVLGADGKSQQINPHEFEGLRKLWKRKSNPPVPKEAAKMITGLLKDQP